jgi:hypothetical protein
MKCQRKLQVILEDFSVRNIGFAVIVLTCALPAHAAEPAPATAGDSVASRPTNTCQLAQRAAQDAIQAIDEAKKSDDPVVLKAALDRAQMALKQSIAGCTNNMGAAGAGMSCCPPGMIQTMMNGASSGTVYMAGVFAFVLTALLTGGILAVLVALTVFLIRRSRLRPIIT